MTALSCCPVL